MSQGIAIFDIGATFVYGPEQGPASRIAAEIDLDPAPTARLKKAIMTRSWQGPDDVVNFIRDELAADHPRLLDAVDSVWTAQQQEATLVPDAREVLREVADGGLRIGLLSNIWFPFLVAVRACLGDLFDRYIAPENQIFSFQSGMVKPSAGMFRAALAAAQVAPQGAVMIGDSYIEDIVPAARLGLATVWLLHRPLRESANAARVLNGDGLCPDHTLTAISDLTPDLLRSVLSRHGVGTPARAEATIKTSPGFRISQPVDTD